jgi:hypothetical protein
MKFDNFNAVDNGFANVSGTTALAPNTPTTSVSAFQTTSPLAYTMNGAQLMSMLPPLDLVSQTFWNNFATANPNTFNSFKTGYPYTIHYWHSGTADLFGKKWYGIIVSKIPLAIPSDAVCSKLFSDTRYRLTSTGQLVNPLYRIFLLFRDFYRKDRCAQEFIVKSNYWRYFTGAPNITEPLIEQQMNPEYTSESQLNGLMEIWMYNFRMNFPNYKLALIRA